MAVTFLDLKHSYKELQKDLNRSILKVASEGKYILGDTLLSFENDWAKYCEARFCVGVANGLDALFLSLLACGVEAGDEVLVPSHTFLATWLAVTRCGAIPVPIEPDISTMTIDTKKIEKAISKKTKVIIAVHIHGQPCELDEIISIASRHKLKIIEDAAQSHGACYKGQKIGSHGDVVCWSFYPGKNLGCMGDAGAITTNDAEISQKVSLLRNYGGDKNHISEINGINSRLDPIQAAILIVKLAKLDNWNNHRRVLAKNYNDQLFDSGLRLQGVVDYSNPVWHVYTVRTSRREALREHLRSKDIETLIHYSRPPHMHSAFNHLNYKKGSLPISEQISEQTLSIPIGPHLSMSKQKEVTEAILSF